MTEHKYMGKVIGHTSRLAPYLKHQNFVTWNVCHWICEEPFIREIAKTCNTYEDFQLKIRNKIGFKSLCLETPDEVAWNDTGIDLKHLDELIANLLTHQS